MTKLNKDKMNRGHVLAPMLKDGPIDMGSTITLQGSPDGIYWVDICTIPVQYRFSRLLYRGAQG